MVVEVVILSEELGPADVLYHNRVSLSNSTITSRFKNCTVFGEFQLMVKDLFMQYHCHSKRCK